MSLAEMPSEDRPKLPDLLIMALVLLPGFLSERVAAYYALSPSLSEVETIASALAFTLVDVACVLGGLRLWARIAKRPQVSLATLLSASTPLFTGRFIGSVLLISLFTGAAWAYLDSHNLLFRAPVSARFSRSPVWDTVFLEHTYPSRTYRHAIVAVDGGAVYSGPVIRYSQEGTENDGMVFLRPVFVEAPPADASPSPRAAATKTSRCRIPGGLLLFRTSIRSVAFRDPLKEVVPPCRDEEIVTSLRVLEKRAEPAGTSSTRARARIPERPERSR